MRNIIKDKIEKEIRENIKESIEYFNKCENKEVVEENKEYIEGVNNLKEEDIKILVEDIFKDIEIKDLKNLKDIIEERIEEYF